MTGPLNTLLRTLAAVASIAAGVLHWDIWANHGYRSTPIRELFVASAVVGVIAGLLAFLPKAASAVPAVLVNVVFLGALVLSRVASVPTFHGPFSASGLEPMDAMIVGVSTTLLLIVAEGAAVVLGVASIFFGRGRRSTPLPSEYARV